MAKFREFILEEGDLLDAVKHGVKHGVRAFTAKRKQQKESNTLANRVLGAEGKELEGLIRQIVDSGFSIKKEVPPQKLTDWLRECTSTRKESTSGRWASVTCGSA